MLELGEEVRDGVLRCYRWHSPPTIKGSPLLTLRWVSWGKGSQSLLILYYVSMVLSADDLVEVCIIFWCRRALGVFQEVRISAPSPRLRRGSRTMYVPRSLRPYRCTQNRDQGVDARSVDTCRRNIRGRWASDRGDKYSQI